MNNGTQLPKVIEKSGPIDIACARGIDGDHVKLNIEGDDEGSYLCLRVYDPKDAVICERLVRSLPATLAFRARGSGRYHVNVSSLHATRARPSRTWNDWREDLMGTPPSSKPPVSSSHHHGDCGRATIEVA